MNLHLICRGTFRFTCREYMSTCTYPNSFGCIFILLDFSLTVKAATLIFISGRGSAISFAKQGKSGSIYYLVKN